MRLFLSREQRILTDIAITILLCEQSSDKVVAEPVVGTLCNISTGGACVELASPLSSGYHLFYQTLKTERFFLLLKGVVPSERASVFSVIATSVWMKSAEEERPPGFQIGMKFREKQAQLFREFKRI